MSTYNFIDLTGMTFGRLTVIKLTDKRSTWLCKCICGEEKYILGNNLRRGLTKSCGCLRKENSSELHVTHGKTKIKRSSEYNTWTNMIQRCTNPKYTSYIDYGGRGITVCKRWEDFETFFEDMGKKPTSNHSLDRTNVDGNYEPNNCKWATLEEQARNKRFIRNKTGYRGVYYHRKKRIWQASIRVEGKNISLGYFKNPEEASKARMDGEIKYWGKPS
ncbi:AP2 domain-containing protein [Paenibacillus qinlingensis]|uniref:AP2/ERF domain-containing protein n=1 Tax=Paenibacillus qinlingensis TaxID=1837343 RepID=A0ABU1P6R2_9BACL|nr:AP2 domain-containing protein [Paenibacillus qinlingensis]MDR6555431.1 hypothetical protein [Paenibacillus qinlingensis]